VPRVVIHTLFAELASHPDVLEVSVVAREHLKWGERPMAFVILHAEPAMRWAGKHVEFSFELKAHARERLPGFAVPEWVAVVEDLPVRHVARTRVVLLETRSHTRKHPPGRSRRRSCENELLPRSCNWWHRSNIFFISIPSRERQ
jgi:acyl-coenzyme A synthetase/AMP-(fatty) acid ligase